MDAIEAVALAMLNGKRAREGWPPLAQIEPGFIDGDEWRLEAADALSAARPLIAAECAKVAERRADERFADLGSREPDTNATYYSGRYGEIYEALDEEDYAIATAIKETIR